MTLHKAMPEDEYHAHQSLSSTGIKMLIKPGGAARFHYWSQHPKPPKKAFDLGHAIHAGILGVGAPIAIIPDDLLSDDGGIRSKDAKAWRDEQIAAGSVVLKTAEYEPIKAAANAVLTHPLARQLLEAAPLREHSLIWTDPETGVELRARPDACGPAALVDVKSAADEKAEPFEFATQARKLGYHIQDYLYREACKIHNICDQPMRFVAVEKEPPYLVSVSVIDPVDQAIAEVQTRDAIRLYAQCVETGIWPGYPNRVHTLRFPGWWRDQHDAHISQQIEDEFAAFFAERTPKGTPS